MLEQFGEHAGFIAAAMGMMSFTKVASAAWFAPIMPFHFGAPIFDPVLILTLRPEGGVWLEVERI